MRRLDGRLEFRVFGAHLYDCSPYIVFCPLSIFYCVAVFPPHAIFPRRVSIIGVGDCRVLFVRVSSVASCILPSWLFGGTDRRVSPLRCRHIRPTSRLSGCSGHFQGGHGKLRRRIRICSLAPVLPSGSWRIAGFLARYRVRELYRGGKNGHVLYFAGLSFAAARIVFGQIAKEEGFAHSGPHVFWADCENRRMDGFHALRAVSA